MKSLLSVLLLVLAMATAASAQVSFGVKVGVQAADLTGSFDDAGEADAFETEAHLGFVGGLTADVPVTPLISIRPEVLYTQRGQTIGVDLSGDGETDATLPGSIDYVEVPLLLALGTTQPNGLTFSIEAGPTVAYEVSVRTECEGDTALGTTLCGGFTGAEEDGLQDLHLGAAVGVTVGAGPFHAGVRYDRGITNLLEEPAGETVYHSVFGASLIYRIGGQ